MADPRGNDDMRVFVDMVEHIFVKVYFDMSSKSVKEYFS